MGVKEVRKAFWDQNRSFAEEMLTDNSWKDQELQEREQILSLLPELHDKRVIDMGAGIGRFTAELARLARHVLAIDLKPEDLEKNRQRNADRNNVDYLCMDITELSLPEASADIIFSSWLLMYLSDGEIRNFLASCHRLLHDDGRLFFRESCNGDIQGRSLFYLGLISWVQTLTPFTIDKNVKPFRSGMKDFLRWIFIHKCALPVQYRSAGYYEALFANGFHIEEAGYITMYKEKFNHENQRYWLLSKKPGAQA